MPVGPAAFQNGYGMIHRAARRKEEMEKPMPGPDYLSGPSVTNFRPWRLAIPTG